MIDKNNIKIKKLFDDLYIDYSRFYNERDVIIWDVLIALNNKIKEVEDRMIDLHRYGEDN